MRRHPRPALRQPTANEPSPRLRVGFVLLPRFTLTAFSGFVDALRLAADEGDRSRPLHCQWSVLGPEDRRIESSCGVTVLATAGFEEPRSFDYIVVVGGLIHGGQKMARGTLQYLQRAAAAGVNLVGLCTGSFALARAGLLDDHVTCVSWFHREDFIREFPRCKVISNQMYVVDRQRLTCAGGTSVAHLAAYIIEHSLSRARAVKALRILIEKQPLPPRTLQPEFVLARRGSDSAVRKSMLLLEQDLAGQVSVERVASSVGLGRRQLERRFERDIGVSPGKYRLKLRMERCRWLLEHTDMQVIDIALECGFRSGAHFSRVIRKTFSRTPMQLRRELNGYGKV
ncbi:MAG TPA: GlxA family transcriptional regulator [Steroidobacter sp.]|nr:GlxA family transcriptional regulator [Steroidobacter sp.]